MPVTPTYPGVYIEEIPSGVRAITGVATSVTAFVGRTLRGPVDDPTLVEGFGDFERRFGGLDAALPLGYAVRDFFMNGGGQALIVRLVAANDGSGVASLKIGTVALRAASPGKWGNKLRAEVIEVESAVADEIRRQIGAAAETVLFHLKVRDTSPGGSEETFLNLTLLESARRADRVLKSESSLVVWDEKTTTMPSKTAPTFDKDDTTKLEAAVKPVADAVRPLAAAYADALVANGAEDAKTKQAKQDKEAAEKKFADARKAADEAEGKMGGADSAALTAPVYAGDEVKKTGLPSLLKADIFNLLCIPPDVRGSTTDPAVYQAALDFCFRRRAMLLVDSPAGWSSNPQAAVGNARSGLDGLGLAGTAARNAAIYFPRVKQADPQRGGQVDTFVPCGIVAGVMARTDVARGVWKAPAGQDAALNGIAGLDVVMTDGENGQLNQLGINCLRSFPVTGRVVWGARTLRGADQLADEYKYVPVRRTALFLEESLYRGLKWVVFEPNDEPLWAQIRMNVGSFLQTLFRQGAFQGRTPREAYFVKCDKETTTPPEVDLGIVNIVVGFAPLKPAEFVIVKVQQIAGQTQA